MLYFISVQGKVGYNSLAIDMQDSFHRWWDDLGDVQLNPQLIRRTG
jgi:hypothetical protein